MKKYMNENQLVFKECYNIVVLQSSAVVTGDQRRLSFYSCCSHWWSKTYHFTAAVVTGRASASFYFALVNLTKACIIPLVKYQMA